MVGSKELSHDLIARVEMPENVFKRLKEVESEMVFKGYYNPAMKDVYSENKEWNDVMATIKESYKYKEELESQMRVDLQMNELGNEV